METERLYEYQLDGQTKYTVYVPENYDENTPVLFYSYVTGSNKKTDQIWQNMEKDIIEQNGDAIIIFPESSPVIVGGEDHGRLYSEEAVAIFDLVKNDLGLETTQFANGGYSAGFGCSLRTTIDYIRSHPNAERQVLFAVDGVMNFPIYDSEFETLRENNTIIISYSQPQNFDYQAGKLKEAGLPILYVVDPEVPEDSGNRYWYYHDLMTSNFYSKGLYNTLLDFTLGKGQLPEGYTYRMYNPETDTIEKVETWKVAEYLGIDSFKIKLSTLTSLENVSVVLVSSNSQVLENYINNVIGQIRGTSFLTNIPTSNGLTSTTDVPNKVSTITNNFFQSNTDLLMNIASDFKEFSKIDTSIKLVDEKLSHEIKEI